MVKYYDDLASRYDADRFGNSYGRFIDQQERILLDRICVKRPGQLILEIGCGTGRLTGMADIGIDVSKEMIGVARQKHPHKTIFQADAAHTPFDKESFDIVFGFHLLMHLDQQKITELFCEAWRILKPGGRLIVDFPSKHRRSIRKRKNEGWHGNFASTVEELVMLQQGFKAGSRYGLLLLPVHRIPKSLRKYFVHIDLMLANTFLQPYSSYQVAELIKI